MIQNFLLTFASLFLVLKGGAWFVDASIGIARHFRWPRMLVGGTLVTLATTAPELIVSITASFSGQGGISVGNAAGSVIVNSGFVIGFTSCLAVLFADINQFRIRALWVLAAAGLLLWFSKDSQIGGGDGIFLACCGIGYLFFDYLSLKNSPGHSPDTADEMVSQPVRKYVLSFTAGAVLILAGSRLLVMGAVGIAQALNMPPVLIGLTIIAFGTSLPEFVTAVMAARRDAADLSVGNILAANIVNLTLVSGIAGLIHPLPVDLFTRHYSYPAMILLLLLLTAAFALKGRAGKKAGFLLLMVYILYTIGLIYFQYSCSGFAHKWLACRP